MWYQGKKQYKGLPASETYRAGAGRGWEAWKAGSLGVTEPVCPPKAPLTWRPWRPDPAPVAGKREWMGLVREVWPLG